MGQKSGPGKEPAGQVVKEIRRVTRRQFSAEEKIRIVLTGLRGEDSIAELCRREGIVETAPCGAVVIAAPIAAARDMVRSLPQRRAQTNAGSQNRTSGAVARLDA